MNRMKLHILTLLIVPIYISSMESEKLWPTHMKSSTDVNFEDLQSGKTKIEAILWDFHNILALPDNQAKTEFATQTFSKFGISFEQLKSKYPEIAHDTQKIILNGFKEIQKKALDSNEALKNAIGNIPTGALGEMYGAVFRNYGYNDMATLADELSTMYQPRLTMKELILALASQGIKHYLGSNIAPHIYECIKSKFKEKYGNNMLDSIEIGAIVDISPYGLVPPSTIPHTKLAPEKKPSGEFFKTYRRTCYNTSMVTAFIDDKEANIIESLNHGPMIGILLNGKDPEFSKKLIESLRLLKITL